MRKTFITILFGLTLALLLEAPALAKTYMCVRPDGTEICTVDDDSGDPSVTCNYKCADCNMVCTAVERIITEGGKTTTIPAKPKPGRKTPTPPPGTRETPEYCQNQLDNCTAQCVQNKKNKKAYDRNACISSCQDTFSGCGKLVQ